MPRIFISYRRDDAPGWTGRLADRLGAQFGSDQVFMDIDDIAPGEDFGLAIQDRLAGIEALVAVIGPDWLDAVDRHGNRRIDNDDDWVRAELQAALGSDAVQLIPVLVDGARMPKREQLPTEVAGLTTRNAIRVNPEHFNESTARLIAAIQGERPAPAKSAPTPVGKLVRSPLAWAGLAALIALLAVAGALLTRGPTVPNVVGITDFAATQILESLGIEADVDLEPATEPEGLVIAQRPDSRSRARQVVLVVSLGPRVPTIPAVEGLDQRAAVDLLSQLGITFETSSADSDQEAGIVLEQFPMEGVRAPSVLLTVASGNALPELPSVRGLTEAEAIAALPAGVATSVVLQESDQVPAGVVASMTPAAGAQAGAVELVVSAGPGDPVVPDVVGLTRSAAVAALDGAGITVDQTESAPDPATAGTVVAQRPAAGERSVTVGLRVSTGPDIDAYEGTWTNLDEQAAVVTKLVIGSAGNDLTVTGFSSCVPDDCEWGTAVVPFEQGEPVVAVFDFGFQRNTVTLDLAGPALLVTLEERFAGERAPRVSGHVFSKPGTFILAEGFVTDVLSVNPLVGEALVGATLRGDVAMTKDP